MVEYITISQARLALKGSIIVKVVSLGEMKSGTGTKGPWKNQTAVLKDDSDTENLLMWGQDIGKLDQGKYYKLESPFWSVYKESPQLSLGKFCTIHDAIESDLIDMDATKPVEPATQSSVTDRELLESILHIVTDLKTGMKN